MRNNIVGKCLERDVAFQQINKFMPIYVIHLIKHLQEVPLLAKGSWVPILKPVPDPRWFYSGVFSPLPYLLCMYADAESKVSSMCYILYTYISYALYTMLL
jgi:hypothetical protein